MHIDENSMKNLTYESVDDVYPFTNTIYVPNLIPTFSTIYIYHAADNRVHEEDSSFHTNSLDTAFGLVSTNGKIIALVYGESFAYDIVNEELTKYNITVEGCNTKVDVKSPIVIGELGELFKIKNIVFENSTSHAIIWNAPSGKIVNCTFYNNTETTDGYGAALVINGNNMEISNSTFINNTANSGSESNGGAIFSNATGIIINHCTFENNTGAQGSHIFVKDSSIIKIIDSNFTFGKSPWTYGGSAVYVEGTINSIDNCEFKNNSASTGAALYVISSTPINLNGNTFSGNNASGDGGAIYVKNGVLNMVQNHFTKNNAGSNGGAIYSESALNIDGSEFNNNIAGSNGGALYITGACTCNNVQFTGNNASKHGSAIYLEDSGNLKLNVATFVDNANTGDDVECTIHVGDGSFTPSGLVLGTDEFGVVNQFICLGDVYHSDVLFVSLNGDGRGVTSDTAAKLTSDLVNNHLNNGGKIIFVDDISLSETVEIINKIGITIVGNNHSLNRKDNTGKYLFILQVFK